VVDDRTLLTSAPDGELSGAARTLRLSHDLLTQLIETGGAGSLDGPLNVGGIDLMARRGSGWSGAGGRSNHRVSVSRVSRRGGCAAA